MFRENITIKIINLMAAEYDGYSVKFDGGSDKYLIQ